MKNGIEKYFKRKISLINRHMDNILPNAGKHPSHLFKAMRYSIMSGGKRIRPIIAIAACEALGGKEEAVLDFACAIEMVHCYSLIHDDLPSMDNDDFRRGKPTCHKVFGEAIAILAGDALLNLAFETVAFSKSPGNGKALKSLSLNAGVSGMIAGQCADILSENRKVSRKELLFIHKNKTAALFSCACELGAIAASAGLSATRKMKEFGYNIGMSFQIADDLLDIAGNEKKAGKKLRKDSSAGKNTYPSVFGLQTAEQHALKYSAAAIKIAESFKAQGRALKEITTFLTKRSA
ncbi:MAG: polyprenyl synthetase family protein [Candidatus Aureabacteria bacterium]|nr:polyprenyl synthetase family protein [Candidatus Auribacterota bacterium]